MKPCFHLASFFRNSKVKQNRSCIKLMRGKRRSLKYVSHDIYKAKQHMKFSQRFPGNDVLDFDRRRYGNVRTAQ